jgi:Na+/phosphate symporter
MTSAPADLLRPLFQDAIEMLRLAWECFRRRDSSGLATADALGRSIHKQENELTERLLAEPRSVGNLRFVPGHLERIGDAVDGLGRCVREMEAESIAFTERGQREIDELFGKTLQLLECVRDLALTRNTILARHVELESMRLQERASEVAGAHEERLIDGVCQPAASSMYLAILDHLREITRHARRIGSRVVEQRPDPLLAG